MVMAALALSSCGAIYYRSRDLGERYTERVARFQKLKDEALSTGNLKLLYSPLVFFYLFAQQPTYDSTREFYHTLTFFKPKLVGVSVSEHEFNARYKHRVKEIDFRNRMADAAEKLEAKEDDQLGEWGSPEDLMHLLVFSFCYSASCEVVFTDDVAAGRRRDTARKMEEIRRRAPPGLQIARPSDEISGLEPSVRELISIVVTKIDPRKSFFEKPLARTYLLALPQSQFMPAQAELKAKMLATYNTVLHDAAETTAEEEHFELQKQSGRFR